MKLIHLSDLHLGKRVNGFSMLDDQAYILEQILQIIRTEAPYGVLIAGDVYDKSVPSAEALQLFDRFLAQLAALGQHVFIISGNHDGAERLAFGAGLMHKSGVYLSPVYDGTITPIPLEDEYGTLNLYLLPFLKPANVRRFFPAQTIESYTDAVSAAIGQMDVNCTARNLLVTHQFVTGAVCCDSEELSVGGSENVDASVFDPFDYVALGHIHGPQRVCRDTIRYCGSPLKYSFSEASHKKSVTIVELFEKNHVTLRTIPLEPKHDLIELKGTYNALMEKSFYENTVYPSSYLHITLRDEDDIPDAIAKLRIVYPLLMKLDYENCRTRTNQELTADNEAALKSPQTLFEEFFCLQNNREMNEEQINYVTQLMEEIWEGAE